MFSLWTPLWTGPNIYKWCCPRHLQCAERRRVEHPPNYRGIVISLAWRSRMQTTDPQHENMKNRNPNKTQKFGWGNPLKRSTGGSVRVSPGKVRLTFSARPAGRMHGPPCAGPVVRSLRLAASCAVLLLFARQFQKTASYCAHDPAATAGENWFSPIEVQFFHCSSPPERHGKFYSLYSIQKFVNGTRVKQRP